MAVWSPAVGLLTRHFLQGLAENDLQAPGDDQREGLAAVGAGLLTAGIFVSVMMGLKYLATPFLTPGRAAIGTLDDAFLFAGWSFVIMALVAVAKWDAMTLDDRDTSILGPLPVKRTVIVRAKLAALILFAAGFAVALNGGPSLIYPLLVAAAVHAGIADGLRLVAAHILSTMGAGVFGFAGVLALRETARGLLGAAVFRRVSPALQGVLLAVLVVAFLLLPGAASGVARTWLAPDNRISRALPPLWFVGLHEVIAGEAIVGQPVGPLPPWPLRYEREFMPLYRSRAGVLRDLAHTAAMGLAAAIALALAAYTWNTRRLPLAAHRRTGRGAAALVAAISRRTVVRRQAVRAGFFFTVQTLVRSATHRAAMAVAVAVGAAATVVNVQVPGAGVQASSIPLPFLGTQLAVVTALVLGFRHATGLPADPRATWTFQLAWSGDDRPYVAGVRRAGLLVLIVPAVFLLLPLHVVVMGWRLACWHLLFGALAGCGVLEASMLGVRRLPFAASYLPGGNLKWAAPVGVFVFLLAASVFGFAERLALGSTNGALMFAGGLTATIGVLRLVDTLQRRLPATVDLVELPSPATQRLNLEP